MVSPSFLKWLIGLLALLGATLAHPQSVLEKAEQFALQQVAGLKGQAQAKAAPLDPRLQLAPCQQMEAFSPAGARPVGSTTVGVRCLTPANWSVLIPVKVSVLTPYVATARQMGPGVPLQVTDITLLQGDLATLPNGTLTDPREAQGKTLKFGLGSGQPIRRDLLASPLLIQQGQDVKLIIVGQGFSVSVDGKAQGNAAEGQWVQVKTAHGSTLSGMARPGGIVEVKQ